jgi:hypothetical protein
MVGVTHSWALHGHKASRRRIDWCRWQTVETAACRRGPRIVRCARGVVSAGGRFTLQVETPSRREGREPSEIARGGGVRARIQQRRLHPDTTTARARRLRYEPCRHFDFDRPCRRIEEAVGETPWWMLVTPETITSEEEVLATFDVYRPQWIVQEYFKAEKRQLESWTRDWATFGSDAPPLTRGRCLSWRKRDPRAPEGSALRDRWSRRPPRMQRRSWLLLARATSRWKLRCASLRSRSDRSARRQPCGRAGADHASQARAWGVDPGEAIPRIADSRWSRVRTRALLIHTSWR